MAAESPSPLASDFQRQVVSETSLVDRERATGPQTPFE